MGSRSAYANSLETRSEGLSVFLIPQFQTGRAISNLLTIVLRLHCQDASGVKDSVYEMGEVPLMPIHFEIH